jgi:tetratricopeptide (TPR) repeat protein
LEEDNLLCVRRTARIQGWWPLVISAMQGLQALYDYQGRQSEWSRLVAEISADYCTPDDAPIPGREKSYGLVMSYRVRLAREHDRDVNQAAALQEKLVEWDRQRAAATQSLFPGPLKPVQRDRLRALAVSIDGLGHILRDLGNVDCVEQYKVAIVYYQRIQDTTGEAITSYNLGHAYKNIPAIRNLDTAEAAYQQSLALHNPNSVMWRSRCLHQIGMIHHERFRESRGRNEPAEDLLKHRQTAERHYLAALALWPPTALTDIVPFHIDLGALYADLGQLKQARDHYEEAVKICEQTANLYGAGMSRFNMALMYLDAAQREATPSQQRDLLLRAQAFAEAALRDFQHYQGRAAALEASAQGLLADIARALA